MKAKEIKKSLCWDISRNAWQFNYSSAKRKQFQWTIEHMRSTCRSSEADALKHGSLSSKFKPWGQEKVPLAAKSSSKRNVRSHFWIWIALLGWHCCWIVEIVVKETRMSYFCKHLDRKSFASAERCSGIGGWDLVVPIWNSACTWQSKTDITRVNTKTETQIHEIHRMVNDIMTKWLQYCELLGKITSWYWHQGGFPVAISIIVQPTLHISAELKYWTATTISSREVKVKKFHLSYD